MAETQVPAFTNNRLFPLYLATGSLLSYIWATPLRDLYGLEARNGLFTKIMVTDGPTLLPTVMGAPYPDYPPLFFWLSWFFSKAAGQMTPLSTVLPSSLAAAVLVGITFVLGKKISNTTALFAAVCLATCPDYWLKAGRATIDMLLALWITLSVLFLYLGHYRTSQKNNFIKEAMPFVMMLFAFLTKGPVGLVLPIGIWSSFLVCEKKWRALFSFALKAFFLTLICITLELIFVWKSGGMELVHQVVMMQVTGRIGAEANEPFYYYFLYLLSGSAPWWIPASLGFVGLKKDKNALQQLFTDKTIRLALCWFFFVLILFSFASTRHSRYLLTLFPALFLLLGRGIELAVRNNKEFTFERALLLLNFFFFLALSIVTFIYVGSPLSYRPPIFYFFVWAICSLFFFFSLRGIAGKEIRLLGLAAAGIGSIMAAEAMLIEPWISHRESGRLFVTETEKKYQHNVPVILYKINPDGDGIKYALNSERRSDELHFAADVKELNKQAPPFILVAFNKKENDLAGLNSDHFKEKITEGLLHGEPITSWFITQNRQPSSEKGTVVSPAHPNGEQK